MHYPLTIIEGLSAQDATKLKAMGIRTAQKLLDAAASARGRRDLAMATGLPEQKLLEWANFVDCMRIKGMGRAKSEILRASGVKTVRSLAQRNPQRLAESMEAANKARKLLRGRISEQTAAQLIAQARNLPLKITY